MSESVSECECECECVSIKSPYRALQLLDLSEFAQEWRFLMDGWLGVSE